MRSTGRPWWQQVTALVSLGAGGAITGFSLIPKTAPGLASPASLPIRLLALHQASHQQDNDGTALRAAIVNVARYYLRVAQTSTPAQMEALIWQRDSLDGTDHGESCAAFASMTLELAAQITGRTSWVSGGGSYPWPLHSWVDARVDPNPASLSVVSILQDAQAHGRWRPLGDGYQPQPGDWVLFDGHVEVITSYAGGVLHTIGGDSLPDFSVNAHAYPAPLDTQGITGFVDNGDLPARLTAAAGGQQRDEAPAGTAQAATTTERSLPLGISVAAGAPGQQVAAVASGAAIPGTEVPAPRPEPDATAAAGRAPRRHLAMTSEPRARQRHGVESGRTASVAGTGLPGLAALAEPDAGRTASIPGLTTAGPVGVAETAGTAERPAYVRHDPSALAAGPGTAAQQAFIAHVAPGAMAAQRKYGVPAAVTIAQAADESGWGQSLLAVQDHNLFGIKGAGPDGSAAEPSQEYEDGQFVTQVSPFRVYRDVAESIADHGRLLASSGYYSEAMAVRGNPDAFASALTGVYATDPDYGSKLITLMRQYDLYRFDSTASTNPSGRSPMHAKARSGGSQPGAGTPFPGRAAVAAPAQPAQAAIPGILPGPAGVDSAPATWTRAGAQPGPADSSPAMPPAQRPGTQPRSVAMHPAELPGAQPGSVDSTAAMPRAEPPRSHSAPPGTRNESRSSVPPAIAWAARQTRAHETAAAHSLPAQVKRAILTSAMTPLSRNELVYRDIASQHGISWQLLAACDWMQCEARAAHSPVYGEKLGGRNPDGSSYRTKSAALDRCAQDLIALSGAVYGIDLTAPAMLSVRELANVFAAFRWGQLLKRHHTSAMEFPYSVAGLTAQHLRMRWPDVAEPQAPDRPGSRFHRAFGAVPVVLSLHYPAVE